MKVWDAYIKLVKRNCSTPGDIKNLAYWRNNLFASTVIYLLPLGLIALLPGIYLCVISRNYVLLIVDTLTIIGIAAIAFLPHISLGMRKAIFIGCLYLLSCTLLFYLGLFGPGLLYLLTGVLFTLLIYDDANPFWVAWANTVICILFAIAIFLHITPSSYGEIHGSVPQWIGVTSNLVFLSFLIAALIPGLFSGLQESLNNETALKEELHSQRQSLQQALQMVQQKNNELEQFAYVASHDLNEPLRMVTSFMGLLKNKYENQLDEKAHTYINFALDGSVRMQKMISDLLDLSRTTNEGRDKELEMVDLNEILEEVKQNIYILIEESNVEIIVKTKLPVLPVYRADISRLLQNLFSNAIKFRKKDIRQCIILNATEQENEWLFNIEDNGIGIEKEKFGKIFEIFGRLHSQEAYEGTGIGLAICKKIVEQNGGEIWLESEKGKGTIFYFTIKK